MTPANSTSIVPDRLYHLDTAAELQPAMMLGLGLPAHVSGLPAFYYWKDALVVGSYIHPAGKFSLDVTRDKLDGYADNFKRMKANGVGVPILMDHAQSAAATLGWIVQVQRRGDRLLELHQFLGESARDIGLRNKVSLGIDPNFIDGKGNHYGEAIVHSAVTPVPVVPNQDGFEQVEMSGDGKEEMILLSLAEPQSPHLAPREDTPGLSAIEEPVQKANDNPPCVHGGLNGDVVELAWTALADAAAAKRDLAVARGAIDPSVADELFALLVRSTDGTVNTMMLSHNGGPAPLALAVFDLLAKNQPAPLGETTSLQVLSRNVPGLDDERLELQQRMIELASGR
jgi:hypothetical protein